MIKARIAETLVEELFLSREILAITNISITEEGKSGHGARFVMTIPASGLREPKNDS